MRVLTLNLPQKIVPTASGMVTASCGIVSPVIQGLCAGVGLLGNMVFLSIPSLLLFPVSLFLCCSISGDSPVEEKKAKTKTARLTTLVREAIKSCDYLYLLAGFFTCGFHMAIIKTHLFTQITTYGFSEEIAAYAFSVYGIATLVGCILSGGLCRRFAMKNVLGILYGSRVMMVLAFLILLKTLIMIYSFAVLLELTGNATVPPTLGLLRGCLAQRNWQRCSA